MQFCDVYTVNINITMQESDIDANICSPFAPLANWSCIDSEKRKNIVLLMIQYVVFNNRMVQYIFFSAFRIYTI